MAGILLGAVALAAEQPPRTPSPATRVPAKPTPQIPTKPGAKKAEPEVSFTPAEMDKLEQIEKLAYERYPKRRDAPLRYANMSDIEVREIQRLASGLAIPELVNIAPVVTGCPCEEGGECTEQVYIVGRFENRHVGIELSRSRNRWGVSRVQRWWLDYSALLAREKIMDRRVFQTAHARQLLDFPVCPSSLKDTRANTTAKR